VNLEEHPVVGALASLSIFDADQAGAYREHFARIAAALGADIPTRLARRLDRWAGGGAPGLCILTGNAGTGKTAATEAYCLAVGGVLPPPGEDNLTEVAPNRWVSKDLSGLPDAGARSEAMQRALGLSADAQVLVCANEGVLRDAVDALGDGASGLSEALEEALRTGAAARPQDPDETVETRIPSFELLVINVNRQRPTSPELWDALLDYVSRQELWGDGCAGCPWDIRSCPMRDNAEALRKPVVRAGLRMLVQLGTGEAVPTLREVLAILAWALTGGLSCREVKRKVRDQGAAAFTAQEGYFALALGHGLPLQSEERSPLLMGMLSAGLGEVADLEVDEWLRDSSGAPSAVQALAGAPGFRGEEDEDTEPGGSLADSRSPLDRVRTQVGVMTFHRLGEMVSTSEDPQKVEAGLEALVVADPPRQALWRRRIFLEAPDALGGSGQAASRLLGMRFFPELVQLAARAAADGDVILELTELVKGLNFLVTGFSSANEGLIVPDSACLFARNPGSFRPARPSMVHSQIGLERLGLRVPDRGLVEEVLDVDHIEVELVVDDLDGLALRIRPRMYEAIREAASFQGPVGQGVAEMTDLRNFYGRLAATASPDDRLRVADPDADPPALIAITLPYFAHER
jgi:hypothetical protein